MSYTIYLMWKGTICVARFRNLLYYDELVTNVSGKLSDTIEMVKQILED